MTQTHNLCSIQLNDHVLCLLPADKDYSIEAYITVPFQFAIPMKKNMNAVTQISLALTYLPALQILKTFPQEIKNKKVLLNGGIGPVNRCLARLSILNNANKVYIPCQKEHRVEVKKIGGIPVGPIHSDWGAFCIGQFDFVVDAIGENSYETSKDALNENGHLCIIGNTSSALNGQGLFQSLNKIILDLQVFTSKRITSFGLMTNLEKNRETFRKDLEYLNELINNFKIKPIFTRVSLDEYYRGSEKLQMTMLNAPVICDAREGFI